MYIQRIGSDCLSVIGRVLFVEKGQGISRCLLLLPIRALHLRMLKHIGCSLSSGCGDTSAYSGNYYRAFAYCPIPFLPTVRLALPSATSEVCRVPQFRDSILQSELGRKAPAPRRRRARRTGKDRQPLSLGLCPIFLSRGLLYGAGSNTPLLSCFDASNARTAVACFRFNLSLAFGDVVPPLGIHPDNTRGFIPTSFSLENFERVGGYCH